MVMWRLSSPKKVYLPGRCSCTTALKSLMQSARSIHVVSLGSEGAANMHVFRAPPSRHVGVVTFSMPEHVCLELTSVIAVWLRSGRGGTKGESASKKIGHT